MAGVEEPRAKDEGGEEDDGDDAGKDGPGLDVELVVGLGFVAHGEKVEGERVKGKGQNSCEGGRWVFTHLVSSI